LSVKAYYRQVEKGFTNTTQSGSGREVGTTKYGVGGTYELAPGTKLSADYYRSKQEQHSTDVTVNSISGGIEHTITSQLGSALRLEDITYEGTSPDTSRGNVSTHSTLGTARLNYSVNRQFSLSAQHERNIGADRDATKPNATSIIGEYKISDRVAIQGQEKLLEDGGGLSSVGVNTTPLEGTSMYGKYEIGNAIGQHRNMLSIGLKNTLKLPWDLTANAGYERATALEHRLGETPTDDHFAYFGGLEYLPERQPVKLSGKAEYGEDRTRKHTNLTFGGDYRFRKDLSLITKYTYSDEQAFDASGYETRYHLIAGLAYRPVDMNWLNVIGKYEFRSDNNHYLHPFIDDGASIISIHAYIEPAKRVELGTKFAYKTSTQNSFAFSMTTHTSFYLLSGRYDLTDRVDVGGEYRILLQSEAGDLLNGYSAEVGYIVMNNLRVAAGYNFKGYKDQDLVDYQLWSKGPFLRMNLKFSEELFGL